MIYLARPCQYAGPSQHQPCDAKYWSSHRYAPQVIESYQAVLNQIKEKTGAKQFVLIGFSGGASIVTLIAAQRHDVKALITVAGDLNHEALTRHHHTTPLSDSLNPMSVAPRLKQLPQHHYAGKRDTIVPPFVAQGFAKAVNSPHCVHVTVLKGVGHHQGWEERWPGLIKTLPTCTPVTPAA